MKNSEELGPDERGVRTDLVTVKVKNGGPLSFSHGRCSLKLGAGETADKWMDGTPITRGEFESVLAPHAEVEIVEAPKSGKAGKEPATKMKDASFNREE